MRDSGPETVGSASLSIQRACKDCEMDDLETKKPEEVQRKASAEIGEGLSLSSSALTTGGVPLGGSTRAFFEPRFGRDFSNVRIHAGQAAQTANAGLGSHAFTYGSHIWLGAGQASSPNSIMAHELAHVVQQTSPQARSGAMQGPSVTQSGRAVRRDTKTITAAGADQACDSDEVPGSASAQLKDHASGPSGTYHIWGPRFQSESSAEYAASAINSWLAWRFGSSLSDAAIGRIRAEAVDWRWYWKDGQPTKGCQGELIMSMDDMKRLLRIAGLDVAARKEDKKEKKAGLPTLAAPAAPIDGMVIEIMASRSNQSGPTTSRTLDPRDQAEETMDPTSVYNRGRRGANYPPFPASMDGPENEVPNGLGEYSMRLHYEEVTDEPVMLLAYGMNSVTYYWELFNVTQIVKGGMGMGKTMLEEAKQTNELAQNLDRNPHTAKAASGAAAQGARNSAHELSEEAEDALRELRNPIKAAAGGSAIDVVTRAYANFLSLELLPASALKAVGGWLIDSFAGVIGGYTKEREIAFPEEPGFYMVRCIAQPGPRGPEKSERRAASVSAKLVEVMTPENLAKNTLDTVDYAISQLQLQKIGTSDPEELKALDKKIQDIQQQSSGDIVEYLTRKVAEKTQEQAKAAAWQKPSFQRELDDLNLRLTQAKEKREGTSAKVHIRPQVAFTSTITGETYPLMIEISPVTLPADDTKRVRVRLFDATVPDRETIERDGESLEEAVNNVFEMLRKNGDLGPGMLFVRMPPTWQGKQEFSLTVSATGGALVKKRLEDLATVLMVLSLAVPGAGEISMALGAGLAAVRLISRALNHTLRFDASAVSDTLAIVGAVAQGAQLIGDLRIATRSDAFVGALRSTSQAEVEAAAVALQEAIAAGKILNATATVVNAGGLIWGNYQKIKEFSQIQSDELSGKLTHAAAGRKRAELLAGLILDNAVMLHGMMETHGTEGKGSDAAKPSGTAPENALPKSGGVPAKAGDTPKAGDSHEKTPPGTADATPKTPQKAPDAPAAAPDAAKPAGPPETIPEADLEKRAEAPAKADSGATPAATKDNVRARFQTPDGLHDIFILEDGRIFRCSLLCSQLTDWYTPFLKKLPEGSRRNRAIELSGKLQILEARAKGGEKSAKLNKEIGALDVAMREFIAPDLARDLQQASEARKAVEPGETFLAEPQVRELLKFFNVDEVVRLTGPDGAGSPQAIRDMIKILHDLDPYLKAADRKALQPVLAEIVEGGAGATHAIDLLKQAARNRELSGGKLDFAEPPPTPPPPAPADKAPTDPATPPLDKTAQDDQVTPDSSTPGGKQPSKRAQAQETKEAARADTLSTIKKQEAKLRANNAALKKVSANISKMAQKVVTLKEKIDTLEGSARKDALVELHKVQYDLDGDGGETSYGLRDLERGKIDERQRLTKLIEDLNASLKLERPGLRTDAEDAIRASSPREQGPNGRFLEPPKFDKPIVGEPQFGHKYGYEHRRLALEAQRRGMTQAQFNDWVNANAVRLFQMESKKQNLSHTAEKPGIEYDPGDFRGF